MMLHKTFLIASSLLLLTSCARAPSQEVLTETRFVRPSIDIVPRPRPVDLRNMEWRVVTHENMDEFIQSIGIGDTGEYVFYVITVRDYEKLALNLDELKRYILQQQEIIAYYEQAVSEPLDTSWEAIPE